MKAWWKKFADDKKYNLATKNCCHAVINALKAGNVNELVKIDDLMPLPSELRLYGQQLEEAVQ